MRIITSCVA